MSIHWKQLLTILSVGLLLGISITPTVTVDAVKKSMKETIQNKAKQNLHYSFNNIIRFFRTILSILGAFICINIGFITNIINIIIEIIISILTEMNLFPTVVNILENLSNKLEGLMHIALLLFVAFIGYIGWITKNNAYQIDTNHHQNIQLPAISRNYSFAIVHPK